MPNKIQFSNPAQTTLSSGISGSDTVLTVDDASSFPATNDFVIKIENELLLVTAVSGNDLTVTRGNEGTTAASHPAGATVNHVLTADGLAGLCRQTVDGSNVTAYRELNFKTNGGVDCSISGDAVNERADVTLKPFMLGNTLTKPNQGDFSWVNQGSATVSSVGMGLFLYAPAGSGNNARILKKSAPSTPYTVTALIIPQLTGENYNFCGLLHRSSSDSKLTVFGIECSAGHVPTLLVQLYTNESTFSSTSRQIFGGVICAPIWLRIEDDGTNRKYHYSCTGVNWEQVFSVTRTTSHTPNEVGFFAESNSSSYGAGIWLLSWKEA